MWFLKDSKFIEASGIRGFIIPKGESRGSLGEEGHAPIFTQNCSLGPRSQVALCVCVCGTSPLPTVLLLLRLRLLRATETTAAEEFVKPSFLTVLYVFIIFLVFFPEQSLAVGVLTVLLRDVAR